MVKSKKSKRVIADDDDDTSDEDDHSTVNQSQKKSVFLFLNNDDDDDDDDVVNRASDDDFMSAISQKKSKKEKKKSKRAAKADSDEELSNEKPAGFEEKNATAPKLKSDKKGKRTKKKNEEEDEIDRLLAELELDNTEPTRDVKKVVDVHTDSKKSKKSRQKNDQKDEIDDSSAHVNLAVDKSLKPVEAISNKDVLPDTADASKDEGTVQDVESIPEESKDLKKKGKSKEDKKRPGKKQLLAMQETLRKIKEEEERVRLEKEAWIKAEEEAAKAREEQLRNEEEERQLMMEAAKAEPKPLSRMEILLQQRNEMTLASLGFKKPSAPLASQKQSSNKAKVNKQKNKKNDVKSKSKVVEGKSKQVVPPAEKGANKELKKEELKSGSEENKAKVTQKDVEDVKDAWDASSESEMEVEDEKIKIQPTVKANVVKAAAKKVCIEIKESVTKSEVKIVQKQKSNQRDDVQADSGDDTEEENDRQSNVEKIRKRALLRIKERREKNEKARSLDNLRSPIVCVLGHVDTGKTKILDKIRHTHVQDGEAGGITQQIGATMVPVDAIMEQAKMVKNFSSVEIKYPGLLIIDTPGHESFSNLRSRGSSLCDIAILVIDIMHGLEPQTIESINLLRKKKTPFIVALNKIDRIYDWKVTRNKDIRDTVKNQKTHTVSDFQGKVDSVILQLAEQGLNSALFYENKDVRSYVSIVPTSASTGEGMGNLLALVVELTQSMMAKRLTFSEELQATVLELKTLPGLGTSIDVILVNGRLKEGDTMILAGMEGPVAVPIRSLLMPQPLRELRVKNPYEEYKEVKGAQGVKVTARDLEKVIAGLNVMVAYNPDEVEILKEIVMKEFHSAVNSIKLSERGVYVQASTLGSLEALLEFLRTSKIPYAGIRIGPVHKKDIMKASIMLEHDSQYAVVLAFDVKIERDAQELADSLGIKIFYADIIYHLFDNFTAYREQIRQQKREEFKHIAVFPCKLRILPNCIFNSRDPIIVGVSVEAGIVKQGTPLCVPTKESIEIGFISTIEVNHKTMESARKGQEVCVKIEPIPGDTPKLYGRHFDHTDLLVSKVTRQSIDACKDYFRDDLEKSDWQLMVELKKLLGVL